MKIKGLIFTFLFTLSINLFSPINGFTTENNHLIIYLHGGGWSKNFSGDRDLKDYTALEELSSYLDIPFTSLKYPLSDDDEMLPKTGFQTLETINNYIKEEKNRNNTREIILMGSSSGAHLALMYSFLYPGVVSKVIAISPPTNLTIDMNDILLVNQDQSFSTTLEKLTDNYCNNDPSLKPKLSPLLQVKSNNSKYLMLTNAGDQIIRYHDHIKPFIIKMQSLNIPLEELQFSTAGHHLFDINQLIFDDMKKRIHEFIQAKPEPRPIYEYVIKSENTEDCFYVAGEHKSLMESIGYTLKGSPFKLFYEKVENSIPLYRYYSVLGVDHFYSTSSKTPEGYQYDRIAGYVFREKQPGTIPLYRYWDPQTKNHFYTTDYLGKINYEKIECYVYK